MVQSMRRRTFLRAGSLGVAALVAGCNSNSSGGANNSTTESGGNATGTTTGTATPTDAGADEPATTQSGPAQFSDVAIQGPTNVTVGEEFTLPVSVANTGGENGTFSDTLSVAEGSASFNRSVTIEGVQPGATANTSVGPINISSTDTYTLAIEGTDTTHEIQVNPVEKQPGGTITADNLKIGVQAISLTPALFYSINTGYGTDGTGTGLLSAGSGNILCVIQVALENVGTNQAEFTIPPLYNPNSGGAFAESSSSPPTMLTLPQGSFYTELPGSGGDLARVQGVKGKPLTDVQLSAGQSRSGWLVAQLPRPAASGSVRVGYQGDSKGSPPEAVWPFAPQSGSTRPLPKFSLDSFDVPNTAQLGRSNSYTIKVTNTGDGPGTYRSITQFKSPDDNWSSYNKQQAKIAPGKSTTFKQPIAYPSEPTLGEAQFRLRPFGKTAAVTFDTTKLTFGKTFTGPLGRSITVGDVQQADSYQLSDQDEPTTPEQSQHFILARVGVEFVEQDAQSLQTSNFNLVSGGSTYETTPVYASRYTSPVQADVLRGSLQGPKGSSQSGYILFSVPRSVTPSNAKIVWSAEDPWARWQSG